VKWQQEVEDLKYPNGILETADGGILILEPQELHKIDPDGQPEWTRSYYYSDIGYQSYLFGPIQQVNATLDGSQVLGRYGDLTTLDREGQVLDVNLTNLTTLGSGGGQVVGVVPGGTYIGQQESRTVYKLTRSSNSSAAWEARFDFIYFDVTLFDPHYVLGTKDGGALFIAPAPHLMGDGAFAVFLARLSRTGDVLWQRIYQGIYEDDFYARELSDGGFLVANTHTFFGNEYSGSYLRLTRLNSSGYLVWDRVYGDGETQIQVKNIIERGDGGFLVAGQHGFRGEDELNQGISILTVNSQGIIPGCRYLAELPKAEMLAEEPATSLTARTPRNTRTGEITAGESTDLEISLSDAQITNEVLCSYPVQESLNMEGKEDPSERIHSFTDSDGLLIGGVQGEDWISAGEVVSTLPKTPNYWLYNSSTQVGEAIGMITSPPQRSYCPSRTYLHLETGNAPSFRVALDGNWQAIPRVQEQLSTNLPAYTDAVRTLLEKNKLKGTETSLDAVFKVDLDGDGADEVIITANHNDNRVSVEGISQGDYSLLLLRKLQGNQVVSIPLYERYVQNDGPYSRGAEIDVLALIDLNGDGSMEIMARENSYQAFRYLVFSLEGDSGAPVLELYCGD
jgi:hypothetical protein